MRWRSRATSAAAAPSTVSLAEFAVSYADQNERDYEAIKKAVASGRIKAEVGI